MQLLESHGHTVQCCLSSEAALATLAAEVPDVVIIDQRLPGMNGLELVKAIRTDSRATSLRLIVYSADDSVSERARAAGADAFWLKGSDQLFDSVDTLGRSL